MKIVIAGGGQVGFYLAQLFESENDEITVIDVSEEKLSDIKKETGVQTITGDSASYKVLKKAGISETDLFVAVTSDEAVNLISCITGKKLGAKYTVARIKNMEYLVDVETLDLRTLGVDNVMAPESLVTREIKYILHSPAMTEVSEIENGKLNLFGLYIKQPSPITGKTISESAGKFPDRDFIITAIGRDKRTIIPNGKTIIKNNDLVYFVTNAKNPDNIFSFTGISNYSIRKVVVIGGGSVGKQLATKLVKYFHLTVIEKDLLKCHQLAIEVPDVEIIHGDGIDGELLKSASVSESDAIIAVTGNSETNIFSCLLAKKAGVKKTVALIENTGIFDYYHKLGVDTLVNKKLATSNFIFHSLHKSGTFSHLNGANAEVLEFIVRKKSRAATKPVRDLKLPVNAIIAGIIRNGQAFITPGDFRLQENDKVFIFTLDGMATRIKSFF